MIPTHYLYIFLPLAFIIHDAEEFFARKRIMPKLVDKVAVRFPRIMPVVQLGWSQSLLLACAGIVIAYMNLWLMHKLVSMMQ